MSQTRARVNPEGLLAAKHRPARAVPHVGLPVLFQVRLGREMNVANKAAVQADAFLLLGVFHERHVVGERLRTRLALECVDNRVRVDVFVSCERRLEQHVADGALEAAAGREQVDFGVDLLLVERGEGEVAAGVVASDAVLGREGGLGLIIFLWTLIAGGFRGGSFNRFRLNRCGVLNRCGML